MPCLHPADQRSCPQPFRYPQTHSCSYRETEPVAAPSEYIRPNSYQTAPMHHSSPFRRALGSICPISIPSCRPQPLQAYVHAPRPDAQPHESVPHPNQPVSRHRPPVFPKQTYQALQLAVAPHISPETSPA